MGKYNLKVKREEYKPVPGRESDGKSAEELEKEHVSIARLIGESRPETVTLVFATLSLFVAALSALALPALFGRVIDSLTKLGPNVDVNRAALRLEIILLVAASLVNALFSFLRGYLFAVAGERVVWRLRQKLFHALLQQEIGFFDQSRVGELISRLGGDTNVLKDAATSNISMALRWGATVIGGVVYLLWVSWKLTLVMLTIVPAIAVSARLYGKYIKKLSKDTRQALAEASEVAEESMSAIRTVRSFANEPRQEAAYQLKIDHTLELGIRSAVASGFFTGGTTGVTALGFIAIVYYGGTLVLAGELTSGILTSFLLYALTIGGALSGLAGLFGQMMSAMGANDRVFALLDRVPFVPCNEGEPVHAVRGDIDFRDVSFSYPSRPDAPVLSNLNLSIKGGSVAALVGPSGGGKTTVISLICRFYDPQEGAVCLDDRPLTALAGSSLRRHIGVVQQEPSLFAVSIRDNIRFGRPDASEADIEAAAKVANAHDFIVGFPLGYGELVGERGVRLSGGQKQRIAIARAVLQNPRILLLDEATSALDSESEHLVKDALDKLMVGRTVLIVAHRLSTVRAADVVFVISGGTVVGSGTHDALLASNPLYSKLVRRQLTAASTMLSSSITTTAAAAAAAKRAAAIGDAEGASPVPMDYDFEDLEEGVDEEVRLDSERRRQKLTLAAADAGHSSVSIPVGRPATEPQGSIDSDEDDFAHPAAGVGHLLGHDDRHARTSSSSSSMSPSSHQRHRADDDSSSGSGGGFSGHHPLSSNPANGRGSPHVAFASDDASQHVGDQSSLLSREEAEAAALVVQPVAVSSSPASHPPLLKPPPPPPPSYSSLLHPKNGLSMQQQQLQLPRRPLRRMKGTVPSGSIGSPMSYVVPQQNGGPRGGGGGDDVVLDVT